MTPELYLRAVVVLAILLLACLASAAPNQDDHRADNWKHVRDAVGDSFQSHNETYVGKTKNERSIPPFEIKSTDGAHTLKIEDLMFVPDHPEVPDVDYFRFNEENLIASSQESFYALWTTKSQFDPEYHELGEWGLFARQFTQTYNFKCSVNFASCLDMVDLKQIKELYPNDRPLARLVYFTLIKYALLHDYTRAMEKTFHDIYEAVVALSPKLIVDFTKQVDPNKVSICKHIHVAIVTSVQLVGYVVTFILSGFPMMTDFEIFDIEYKDKDFFQMFLGQLPGWTHATYGEHGDDWKAELLPLDQGFSQGLVCSVFEGDDTDRNPQNMEKLRLYAHDRFQQMEEKTRKAFQLIYDGQILTPGQPSMMAVLMSNRKWVGTNSMTTNMMDMEPIREKIQRSIFVDLITHISTADGNYMKCSHKANAEELCAKASEATHGWLLSIFCPRPKTDPELICQTARIYHALYSPHEIRMAGQNSFDLYDDNRLRMKRIPMLTEAYNNYIKYGNNMSPDGAKKELIEFSTDGFRMPVCQHDSLEIVNFGGSHGETVLPHEEYKRQWKFPAFCGDWRGNETRPFWDAIGAGIKSQAHENFHFGWLQQLAPALWRDRIPRLLEGLPPYEHYMAFGWHAMQFPDRTIKTFPRTFLHNHHRVFLNEDKDFDMIRNATRNMGPWEANYWFCAGKVHHSVFQRERNFMSTTSFPLNNYKSHGKRCDKWWKDNKVDREVWEKGERW